jgi:hypothetical protein
MSDADLVAHLQEWTSLVQSIRSDVVCDLERFRGVSECLSRSSAKLTHHPRENPPPSSHGAGQASVGTSKYQETAKRADIRNHVSDARHQCEQHTSKGNLRDEAHHHQRRSWKEAVEEEDPAFPPAPPAPASVSMAASAYGVSLPASKVLILTLLSSGFFLSPYLASCMQTVADTAFANLPERKFPCSIFTHVHHASTSKIFTAL